MYRPNKPRISKQADPPQTRQVAKNWIPEKDRDTRWYIFHELYRVRVPYLQTRSVDDIKHFGVPTSGDTSIDKEIMNEIRDVMVPIDKMAQWFKEGVAIGVVNIHDTRRIYERISNHLEAWKYHLTKSLNIGRAPLEDLLLLDRFAHSVYEFAKYEFADEGFIESLLIKMNGSSLTASLNQLEQQILNPVVQQTKAPEPNFRIIGDTTKPPIPVEQQSTESLLPARRSLAEFFTPRQSKTAATVLNTGLVSPPTPTRSVSPSIAALLGRAGSVEK